MKKFFKEFKTFITRGNVLDMAVGIIVGGAFTAIITALVNNILTPLINWIPGADNTGALQVILREAITDDAGNVVTEALIIDFGAVISAIISFLITAFVLFLIIKTVNHIREKSEKLVEEYKKKQKEENGEVEEVAVQAAEEASVPEVQAIPAPTSEELLTEIRDLLKAQNSNKEND
ncbi:MAG: large conductance mechanosensitive channel protein MscL [Clostridia bacterium]|nr:large conductance mechanosensitive channel protein MscL [Clostridia bacterium]